MPPSLRLNAVAFISPQNQPILIRTYLKNGENAIKYHYIAHTSLDVIEERVAPAAKATECYLGLLYSMEDVAVYGYMTPLRVKIVLAFALSDSVVKDAEVNLIFKALHSAYYQAVANPFLKLDTPADATSDHSPHLLVGKNKWTTLRRRVDEISKLVGNPNSS
ncbi:Sedlin, N-terminal conserved region-domain-containing protein [Flagelloscypha sp. PMI_526]|nr:Sedlin, N-terminal conserved region-domain-containing protein [Flagelloscypha sp. PMI_526]